MKHDEKNGVALTSGFSTMSLTMTSHPYPQQWDSCTEGEASFVPDSVSKGVKHLCLKKGNKILYSLIDIYWILEINKKDPSTSWTKKTLKSVQWSDLLQRMGCKRQQKTAVCLTNLTPNKPHVTPKNKCPHVSGIRSKNISQHFPFTSTFKIPLLKILAATFPVRPAPMMPTLRRCKAPTGNDWGFMGFLNSGKSIVMPSCRSCRNPEVRSAQSYNALAKQGFWVTKNSCSNWWNLVGKNM